MKGDADPDLVSVTAITFAAALDELSPGTEIFGYDPDEAVFVVRLKGGPFDLVRGVPIGREPADYITNGLFVVIRAGDGDVLGTGGLRY